MRLIDAEALKTIKSIQSADFNSIETIRQWIDSAPTIDTTIDIVRCKDCKYIGKVGDLNVCRIHEISTRADDYCSRGEREEEIQGLEYAETILDSILREQEEGEE